MKWLCGRQGVNFARRRQFWIYMMSNVLSEISPSGSVNRDKSEKSPIDFTWLDLWDRPNCCTALSALQGNSSVMWTRRDKFVTRRSAWREIPELAASEMTANGFRPIMKWSFSTRLIFSSVEPSVPARFSYFTPLSVIINLNGDFILGIHRRRCHTYYVYQSFQQPCPDHPIRP